MACCLGKAQAILRKGENADHNYVFFNNVLKSPLSKQPVNIGLLGKSVKPSHNTDF